MIFFGKYGKRELDDLDALTRKDKAEFLWSSSDQAEVCTGVFWKYATVNLRFWCLVDFLD